jgi:spermidine synthase
MTFSADRARMHAAVGLLSAAVIAYQLALMQILCIVQWYHFASMVISIALLGFGTAGALLAVLPQQSFWSGERALPLVLLLCGTAMSLVVRLTRSVRFDVYLFFADPATLWRLPVVYVLYFLPLFFAGMAIGIFFTRHADRIGSLYLTNLVGSGAGSAAAIALAWIFPPGELPAVLATLPLAAGMVLFSRQTKPWEIIAAILAVMVVHFALREPAVLSMSEYKPLAKTLALPGAVVTERSVSPYGAIDVVASPALRYAPGVSLAYRDSVRVCKILFTNGDWYGPLLRWRRARAADVLMYSTQDLPFAIGLRRAVLVLDAGTGAQAMHALRRGARAVTAVEPNAAVVRMMKDELAAETDSIYCTPSVHCAAGSSRTFIQTDTMRFDAITVPVVGAFGGTSGLFALQEQYLLTKDAFHVLWKKLTPGGVLSLTCWMDQPARNPVKLFATAIEMLEEEHVGLPRKHIVAVRNWATITAAVKRTPFTESELRSVRKFCDTMMFDLLSPTVTESNRQPQFHTLQDSVLESSIERCFGAGRKLFLSSYDFNVTPATDDRPYFSQFMRWQSLSRLAAIFGDRALSFFEAGYLIVLVTLVQTMIAALLLILLPLFRLGWKGGGKFRTAAYFAGIGAGYMCIEIVFIQRFVLYFGSTLFAAGVVIGLILFWSGIGSGYSSAMARRIHGTRIILACIALLTAGAAFGVTPLLQATIGCSVGVKALLAVCLIAPLAFLMGMPFPLGISALAASHAPAVPWAWGINGCVSVISSVAAVVIAVELGFICVMITASLAYVVSLLAAYH